MAFLWNVTDGKARFLLASKVSEARDINVAVAVFKEAIKNAHEKLPEQILTDSWKSCKHGISKTFQVKPMHVAKCGIAKSNNNNRMERSNGTIRERAKIVRTWKKHLKPLAEGQRIHYKFVKRHEALEGQTPAQRAGIEIRTKWIDLLGSSIQRKN